MYFNLLVFSYVAVCGSPFCATGVFSGNPLFIDLEEFYNKNELKEYGLNKKMDYTSYKKIKMELLYVWFSRTDYKKEIEDFKKDNSWVTNYARFMTIRHRYKELKKFPKELKDLNGEKYKNYLDKHKEMIEFYEFPYH